MLKVRQILVSTISLSMLMVALVGCGQRGPLFIPTDPAAKGRATLPDLIVPGRKADPSEPATETPRDNNAPLTAPASGNRSNS